MSEERTPVVQQQSAPSRGMPGLTWAVILIAVGVVVLLNNLNLPGFHVNLFQLAATYWPVILILIGLDILVGRMSVFGSLAVAALAIAVIGGLVWFAGRAQSGLSLGPTVTRNIVQPLGGAKQVRIQMSLGAGETIVKPITDSQNVVKGTYQTNAKLEVTTEYKTEGDSGVLVIRQKNVDQSPDVFGGVVGVLDLGLTNAVPVDLDVDTGAGSLTLDLTGIKLRSLIIDAGVGEVTVILPAEGDFTVKASSGVGALTIRVPKGLEGRISYDGGISNLNVPSRFTEVGKGQYRTSGFDTAANRVSIDLNIGIGSVEVRDN